MKKRFSRDRRAKNKLSEGRPETRAARFLPDEDEAGEPGLPAGADPEDDIPDEDGPPAPDRTAELISLVVTEAEAGQRLDVALASRCGDFSRSQLARLAKDGLVSVSGRPAKASSLVEAGLVVTFPHPRPPLTELRPEPDVNLELIWEDDHLLAVNKPWGLAVHPAPGYQGPTVAGALLALDPRLSEVGEHFRPGLVHRLDRDTSGVLVAARTERALRNLAEAFSLRRTVKRYLAFVKGRPRVRRGTVELPIGRHPTQRHKMAAGVAGGRPARTFYRVARHFPASGVSLVLLTLVTGRTHQARVHLASLGTPVLADPVYSRGTAELVKNHPHLAPFLQRQMLHARRLTIAHPLTGEALTFRAPWPPDFAGLMRALLQLERETPEGGAVGRR